MTYRRVRTVAFKWTAGRGYRLTWVDERDERRPEPQEPAR